MLGSGPIGFMFPKEENYYVELLRLYFNNQLLKKVKEIRLAKTEAEALEKYNEKVDSFPSFDKKFEKVEDVLSAINKMKEYLAGEGIDYPTEEEVEEKRRKMLKGSNPYFKNRIKFDSDGHMLIS